MPVASSLLNYCLIRPGKADQIVLPLVSGSGVTEPSGLSVVETASNILGPVNALNKLISPLVAVRCRVHATWFRVAELSRMLARDSFGQLASWGEIQVRNGSETPTRWSACKVERFSLVWGGVGSPLSAEILIRPYGSKLLARNVTFTPPYGPPYQASGVSYVNLSRVEGGRLDFNNRLAMDIASPQFASIDGKRLPRDYHADSPLVTLTLIQKTTGLAMETGDVSDQYRAILQFADRGGDNAVRFQLNLQAPDTERPYDRDAAYVIRTYRAIRRSAASPMFWISAA